ncbi:MAG: glutamate 5-kinase [Candidatus Omnitrophica bacterium]|nr:glutamate 5-kinase [Candidatus Omnitrophota bacterium]
MLRKFPRPVKKIVVKVGSSLIATYQMEPRKAELRSLVNQICALRKRGIQVVLVSSGAIVLGMGEMGLKKRPTELSALQSLAAIGQTLLMRVYMDIFKKCRVTCSQVLLTWDDFSHRDRFNNIRNIFKAMLECGVVPVVNENDTISTDEIKFGDNDKLSALVASLIEADLLVILSDVEGLYEIKDGEKKVFSEIKKITEDIEKLAGGTNKKDMSKGGMATKLDAVKIATKAKIPCVIAHGEARDVLLRVHKGERLGTFFVEEEEKLVSRKHWISFGSKPKGVVVVDDGAKEVLQKGGKSLLLPGIVSWEGQFKKNDVVVVEDKKHEEIARGMVNYSAEELANIVDKKGKPEAIHCDNMVVL